MSVVQEIGRGAPHRHVTCTATGCTVAIDKGMLFCRDHYFSLPVGLRRSIGYAYRAGQRDNYQRAVREAVEIIEAQEGVYSDVFGNRISVPSGRTCEGGEAASSPSRHIYWFEITEVALAR